MRISPFFATNLKKLGGLEKRQSTMSWRTRILKKQQLRPPSSPESGVFRYGRKNGNFPVRQSAHKTTRKYRPGCTGYLSERYLRRTSWCKNGFEHPAKKVFQCRYTSRPASAIFSHIAALADSQMPHARMLLHIHGVNPRKVLSTSPTQQVGLSAARAGKVV